MEDVEIILKKLRQHWERRHLAGRLTLAGEPAGWKPALPVLAHLEVLKQIISMNSMLSR
jgi:hypothetical protein